MTVNINVQDSHGSPISGAYVQITGQETGLSYARTTDGGGYSNIGLPGFHPREPWTIVVLANNFNLYTGYGEVTDGDQTQTIVLSFKSASRNLDVLAHLRGAMWTARAAVPWGPRPMQPDNCICIDYFECFSDAEQQTIINAYARERGYTHAPMGPLIDPGYHGQLPSTDGRDPYQLDRYLSSAARLEQAGVHVVHFLRPDRGVVGLDWTVDDLNRELGGIFRSARVQQLFSIVCLGWEPGPKYFYDNAWWTTMCAWMAQTFPQALRLIHFVPDCDAPSGAEDGSIPGYTHGRAWANVAPYIHGFLAQYEGYVGGQSVEEFIPNIQNAIADMSRRFKTGGPDGTWPTSSAWGEGQPIRVYAGEYAAYRDYWQNSPEADGRRIGDACMAVGAAGYLDGGTV